MQILDRVFFVPYTISDQWSLILVSWKAIVVSCCLNHSFSRLGHSFKKFHLLVSFIVPHDVTLMTVAVFSAWFGSLMSGIYLAAKSLLTAQISALLSFFYSVSGEFLIN